MKQFWSINRIKNQRNIIKNPKQQKKLEESKHPHSPSCFMDASNQKSYKKSARKQPSKQVEQGFHSIRGFGAVILIALGKFLNRNCRAVVKEEANYAAQFGAPFYIEKWKKSQLQIAICCGMVLCANAYAIGAGELQSDPSHWRCEEQWEHLRYNCIYLGIAALHCSSKKFGTQRILRNGIAEFIFLLKMLRNEISCININ